MPIIPTINSSLTPSQLTPINPPLIQKLNCCDRLKYIAAPVASEINKVPSAVPANVSFTGSVFPIDLELIK